MTPDHDEHISLELLEAVLDRGTIPVRVLLQALLDHTRCWCPECRGNIETFLAAHAAPAPDYGGMEPRRPEPDERTREREREAASYVDRLRSAAPEDRSEMLRSLRTRERPPILHRLLAVAREEITRDPSVARALARLAEELARHVEPRGALLVRSTTFQAAAAKAGDDFELAGQLFRLARRLVHEHRVTDVMTLSLLDNYEGSYWKDRRQWDRGETLLGRALVHFRALRRFDESAYPLLALAGLHFNKGEPAVALHYAKAALPEVPEGSFLELSARHVRCLCLVETDEYTLAGRHLREDEALWAAFPAPLVQLRRRYLEARIAEGKGHVHKAERLFAETRDGFLAHDSGYEAALVALDLALFYAVRERWEDLVEVAEGLSEVLASYRLHDEARVALLLFQHQARARTVTAERIRRFARFLRLAQSDPGFAWKEFAAAG